MKIYSFPTFNLAKILLTAQELAMDYEWVHLDLSKGEHKSADHIARHPLGKVPAMEYEGEFYIESNAICRFLAGLNDNKLYADDPRQRAKIDGWMDFMALHAGRWIGAVFFEEVIRNKLMGGDPQEAILAEANGYLNEQLPFIDRALQASDFLAGDTLTIADIVCFSYFYTGEYSSLNVADYPAIARWYDSIKSRPAYAAVMAQSPTGGMVPFTV